MSAKPTPTTDALRRLHAVVQMLIEKLDLDADKTIVWVYIKGEPNPREVARISLGEAMREAKAALEQAP